MAPAQRPGITTNEKPTSIMGVLPAGSPCVAPAVSPAQQHRLTEQQAGHRTPTDSPARPDSRTTPPLLRPRRPFRHCRASDDVPDNPDRHRPDSRAAVPPAPFTALTPTQNPCQRRTHPRPRQPNRPSRHPNTGRRPAFAIRRSRACGPPTGQQTGREAGGDEPGRTVPVRQASLRSVAPRSHRDDPAGTPAVLRTSRPAR